jgi:quercetin dioxygenase-like cupin family protein
MPLKRLSNEPRSRVLTQTALGRWSGVEAEPYKKETNTYRGVSRYELVGKQGERTAFHTRYFEIEPNGFSTLERHQHEHVVIVVRGQGEVQLGCEIRDLAPGDIVYVCPNEAHQFRTKGAEPFGFLCMVDAKRDRAKPLKHGETCAICE